MSYSEEEIQKYLNILQSYKDTFSNTYLISQDTIPLKTPEKLSCHNCDNTHFIKYNGYSCCNSLYHFIKRGYKFFFIFFITFYFLKKIINFYNFLFFNKIINFYNFLFFSKK